MIVEYSWPIFLFLIRFSLVEGYLMVILGIFYFSTTYKNTILDI